MFDAHVLKVLIATPGDTGEEVDAIEKSLHGWNRRRAEAEGVILLPRHWKSDTVPLLNSTGAQSVIDSQIVDDSDIVIAVFDSRLGKATQDAVSGTAHEIERTAEAGKPVHVYFSDEPVSRSADPAELARLNAFRAEMEAKGLLGVYADPTDLGYQVREAIEHDVTAMDLGVVRLRTAVGPIRAMPRARYDEYEKRLVVDNMSSNVRAEQLVLDIEEGNFEVRYDGEPIDLPPLASAHWPIITWMGSDRQMNVTMRWTENGRRRKKGRWCSSTDLSSTAAQTG